jgi:hypothetical protein
VYEQLLTFGGVFGQVAWYSYEGSQYHQVFAIRCAPSGLWQVWLQGECRDYPGLPELVEALEDLRDWMKLTPVSY